MKIFPWILISRKKLANLEMDKFATGHAIATAQIRSDKVEKLNETLLQDREVLGNYLANAEKVFEWWTGKTLQEGRRIRNVAQNNIFTREAEKP